MIQPAQKNKTNWLHQVTRRMGLVLILTALTCACTDEATPEGPQEAVNEIELTEHQTTVGPVQAIERIGPPSPRLGDIIHLELEVTAEPGVEIIMPPFGDQLGRFAILDFTPTQITLPDGRTQATQRYRLDAPMSGKQRIPSLLIEFVDRRQGESDALKELLTEELDIEISSVMAEDPLSAKLRPPRAPLEPLITPPQETEERGLWLLLGGLALTLVLAVLIALWLLRKPTPDTPPWELAMARLDALEARGLPDAERADRWYVELSNLVRRYVEGRYGLRAPELTTEEFLWHAGAHEALLPNHRAALRQLLSQADKVKFAGLIPSEQDSKEALSETRQFLVESKPVEEAQGASA